MGAGEAERDEHNCCLQGFQRAGRAGPSPTAADLDLLGHVTRLRLRGASLERTLSPQPQPGRILHRLRHR
eukprot:scaffold109923_cov30-Tisochrysis_lutea.AAC.1